MGLLSVSLSKLFIFTLSVLLKNLHWGGGHRFLSLLTPSTRLLRELGPGPLLSAWVLLAYSGVWGVLDLRATATAPGWARASSLSPLHLPPWHKAISLLSCVRLSSLRSERNVCAFTQLPFIP